MQKFRKKEELFQFHFSMHNTSRINKFVYGRIFFKDNILQTPELKEKCIFKKIRIMDWKKTHKKLRRNFKKMLQRNLPESKPW